MLPKSLPVLLEKLQNQLANVDVTVEAICLIVRDTDKRPFPLLSLTKLYGLREMVRESVAEIEEGGYSKPRLRHLALFP